MPSSLVDFPGKEGVQNMATLDLFF